MHARSHLVPARISSISYPDHFSIAEWPFAGPWTTTFLNGQLHPED
jgi:hypothetical protein